MGRKNILDGRNRRKKFLKNPKGKGMEENSGMVISDEFNGNF